MQGPVDRSPRPRRRPRVGSRPALTRYRVLGAAGSVLLAAGGISAGALPAHDPFAHLPAMADLRSRSGPGLVCVYFGLALLVVAWWRLGRLVRGGSARVGGDGGAPGPGALWATLAIWSAPLLLAPPMFSRDVYSYLAQGAMVAAELDVYQYGPAVLGGPFAAEVPMVWQHTPAPYGPVFLLPAAAVATVAGGEVLAGVVGMRLVAVLGVGLLAVVLPTLARRCRTDPSAALWLGVLNPLVLIHLVAGAHNDALMVGLLAAGLAAAVARRPALGAALVTLAALVKAPAALGLAFVVAIWVTQLGGRWRWAGAAAGTAAVAGGTAVVTTALSGTGYGWVGALHTPVSTHSWSLGGGLGWAGEALLGAAGVELAVGAWPLWRWAGLGVALGVCVLVWLRRARLGPVYALGLALTAVVLLGPAVRPWYVLWGLVPIAAAAPEGRMRRYAPWACAGIAVVVLPHGFAPQPAEVGLAMLGVALAAALVLVLLTARHRDQLPLPPSP